jgi:hypothetical protein
MVPSCEWGKGYGPCDASGPVIVYKTKNDYINNVTVLLSKDKKSIVARPGQRDALRQRPLELADGYLLKRMVGDAYLSLTIEEFADTAFDWDNQNLIQYVIDTDPYLEKYECCEYTGKDTVQINILIKEDKLFKCDDIK